jgi:5-methylcytosine-specific restriction enzyme subunit McrC
LWLKTEEKSLIADAKYKIVYSDEKDPKKGISQNDLYQMLAYAVRFEVDEIILFYPNTLKQAQEENTELTIKDALAQDKEISIKAFQLPIINRELLSAELETNADLNDLFETTKEELKTKIKMVLYSPRKLKTN